MTTRALMRTLTVLETLCAAMLVFLTITAPSVGFAILTGVPAVCCVFFALQSWQQ